MPQFNQAWFLPYKRKRLASLCPLVKGLDGAVIEVGCWEGASTHVIANAFYPEVVHCVDHWQGSLSDVSGKLAKERDVFAVFEANMGELTQGNYEVHRTSWQDFFSGFSAPVKFIHIDADHSREEVRTNIEAVLPLMVPGGLLVGDDASSRSVREGVVDALGGFERGSNLWWRVV